MKAHIVNEILQSQANGRTYFHPEIKNVFTNIYCLPLLLLIFNGRKSQSISIDAFICVFE